MPRREDDVEPELQAFPVRSSKAKSAKPISFPHLGRIEDVELCNDDNAGPEQHMDVMERLAKSFETAVDAHEPLMAMMIAHTEERCAAEKRVAVEAATQAAIQTTELRCAKERREAVAQALREAKEAARLSQSQAVAEAIRQTEQRCAGTSYQSAADSGLKEAVDHSQVPDDEAALAADAASNFEAAAASAGAALAAASSLLNKPDQQVEDDALATEDGVEYF